MVSFNRKRSVIISQLQAVLSIKFSKLGSYREGKTYRQGDNDSCVSISYPANILDFFIMFGLK